MRAQKTEPLALLRTIGCAFAHCKTSGVLFPTAVPPEGFGGGACFAGGLYECFMEVHEWILRFCRVAAGECKRVLCAIHGNVGWNSDRPNGGCCAKCEREAAFARHQRYSRDGKRHGRQLCSAVAAAGRL